MPFAFSQSTIERRMNKALGKGKVRLGRNGEAPNFVQIVVIQESGGVEEENHTLSLIRNQLITLTRTGDIADEFVATVEFDNRHRDTGIFDRLASSVKKDDMEITASRRSEHNIDEMLASMADRIANKLVRIINYPDCYLVMSTSFAGEIRTGRQLKIGRARTNDLVISDAVVGSHHAVISRDLDDGSWHIIDLGSVNGTSIDGIPLHNTKHALEVGNKIMIAERYQLIITGIEDVQLEPPVPKHQPIHRRQNPVEEDARQYPADTAEMGKGDECYESESVDMGPESEAPTSAEPVATAAATSNAQTPELVTDASNTEQAEHDTSKCNPDDLDPTPLMPARHR